MVKREPIASNLTGCHLAVPRATPGDMQLWEAKPLPLASSCWRGTGSSYPRWVRGSWTSGAGIWTETSLSCPRTFCQFLGFLALLRIIIYHQKNTYAYIFVYLYIWEPTENALDSRHAAYQTSKSSHETLSHGDWQDLDHAVGCCWAVIG